MRGTRSSGMDRSPPDCRARRSGVPSIRTVPPAGTRGSPGPRRRARRRSPPACPRARASASRAGASRPTATARFGPRLSPTRAAVEQPSSRSCAHGLTRCRLWPALRHIGGSGPEACRRVPATPQQDGDHRQEHESHPECPESRMGRGLVRAEHGIRQNEQSHDPQRPDDSGHGTHGRAGQCHRHGEGNEREHEVVLGQCPGQERPD